MCIDRLNSSNNEIQFKDKYHLALKENIFWAKRNIIDYMWKSANLEGINITYQDTTAIFNGFNLSDYNVMDIVTLNNLKHCWNYITSNLTEDTIINLDLVKELHKNIGAGLIDHYGQLRTYDVKIGGTNWRPTIPNEFKLTNDILDIVNSKVSYTEKSLDLMLYLMRAQAFNDGNKRTSMMTANVLMIKHGCGVISIPKECIVEFSTLLIEFYETNKSYKIKKFLYDNCIDGYIK